MYPVIALKLSAAIHHFDAQLRADGKSPKTLAVYRQDLRSFRGWLGKDLDVSKITPALLARFFTSRRFARRADGHLKTTASLNRTKSAIRSFFRFLSDAEHICRNPARLIRLSRTSRKPPSWLTQKESERLLRTIRMAKTPTARRDYVIFSVLLGTGIRLGSLVALNVGDVVLARSTVQVNGKGSPLRSFHIVDGDFATMDFLNEGGFSMPRKRYSVEQILSKLREAEVALAQGATTAEVCRNIGVTDQTYYRWRKEYGGLRTDQARRLKELEQENSRLKKLVADQAIDIAILKEAASGNS
jgi:putative transposase